MYAWWGCNLSLPLSSPPFYPCSHTAPKISSSFQSPTPPSPPLPSTSITTTTIHPQHRHIAYLTRNKPLFLLSIHFFGKFQFPAVSSRVPPSSTTTFIPSVIKTLEKGKLDNRMHPNLCIPNADTKIKMLFLYTWSCVQ